MSLQAHFSADHQPRAPLDGVSEPEAIRIERRDGMTECIVVFLPAEALGEGGADDGRRARGAGLPDPAIASLASVLRDLVGRGPADADRSPSALDARRLRKVLAYIEAHLADPITLADMADVACLSPFHFCRRFHAATGRPPRRYLTDRRIRAAQAMLAAGRGSMVEVALAAGFGSQASFSRAFRKATDLSPGQYRDLHRRRALKSADEAISVAIPARPENTGPPPRR